MWMKIKINHTEITLHSNSLLYGCNYSSCPYWNGIFIESYSALLKSKSSFQYIPVKIDKLSPPKMTVTELSTTKFFLQNFLGNY